MRDLSNVIEPLGSRILVEPIDPESPTSILEIPEDAKELPRSGKIVAVSRTSSWRDALDKVAIFQPHAGLLIDVDGQRLRILDDSEVQALLKEDDDTVHSQGDRQRTASYFREV